MTYSISIAKSEAIKNLKASRKALHSANVSLTLVAVMRMGFALPDKTGWSNNAVKSELLRVLFDGGVPENRRSEYSTGALGTAAKLIRYRADDDDFIAAREAATIEEAEAALEKVLAKCGVKASGHFYAYARSKDTMFSKDQAAAVMGKKDPAENVAAATSKNGESIKGPVLTDDEAPEAPATTTTVNTSEAALAQILPLIKKLSHGDAMRVMQALNERLQAFAMPNEKAA